MSVLIRTRCLLVADTGAGELLLVNTLTGALHRLPTGMREVVASEDRRVDLSELADDVRGAVLRMKQWGYFFASVEEEQAAFDTLRRRVEAIRRQKPSLHSLALTHSCFFGCVYCFERDTTAHSTFLSVREVAPFLEGLAAFEARIGAVVPPRVALYGGEPLQPRTYAVVEELLRRGGERGITFSAVTNGFFLERFVDLFAAHRRHFLGIQVVLDGPAAVHDRRRMLKSGAGTFAQISAGVTCALDAGLSVRVRVNLDRDNFASLPELSETFAARGWTAAPGFQALVAPVEDHLCHDLPHLFAEDELIAAYLGLEAEHAEALSVFESEKILASMWYVESRVQRHAHLVLPKLAYCDAHSGKAMCFGADGAIYACYKALEDRDAQVGTFLPRFTLDETKLEAWLGRTVADMARCCACPAATLCGGGCAYSQLKRGLPFDDGKCPPVASSLDTYARLRRDLIRIRVPSVVAAATAR